jgi:hypothetical protein
MVHGEPVDAIAPSRSRNRILEQDPEKRMPLPEEMTL